MGIWWSGSWRAPDPSLVVPAELEKLGYGALWSSGGFGAGLAAHFERLLAATDRIGVASGIVNIWKVAPSELASGVAALETRYPGRFLLGLGASHAAVIEHYERPYSHMVEYLDALDAATPPVAEDRRVLAALGPRMLELAGARTAGAHPYLIPVEHTARARSILGPGPLLAPEVTVVVESDPDRARARAREFMSMYLTLENYVNNLRSLGYREDDFEAGGSDRLVDALVGWGGPDAVAERVHEHLDAGANHVCMQVLPPTSESFPMDEYGALAPVVLPGR